MKRNCNGTAESKTQSIAENRLHHVEFSNLEYWLPSLIGMQHVGKLDKG